MLKRDLIMKVMINAFISQLTKETEPYSYGTDQIELDGFAITGNVAYVNVKINGNTEVFKVVATRDKNDQESA